MTNPQLPDTSLDRNEDLAVSGVDFRLFHDSSDLQGMAVAYTASNTADGVGYAISPQDLERIYIGDPNLDPYKDLLIAEANGSIVSYTLTTWWDEVKGTRIYYHNTFTLPDWRDKGIELASLRRAERRLLEFAATRDAGGTGSTTQKRVLESVANSTAPARTALLQTEGYQPARNDYRMVRPDLDNIPAASLPAGIEARSAEPEHYQAVWDAILEAFADEWGMSIYTEEDYRHFKEGPFFQPDLWQVAWDGEQVAGAVLNFINEDENSAHGRRRGYINTIGVRQPWRRRGIAGALVARTLDMFRDKGMAEAALAIDSADANGCLHLCASTGFRLATQVTFYRKPLS